jgi:hypothetical protein
LSDKHSIGNREADRLANMAICTEEEMIFKESMYSNKNYINIAYMYKDVIKKFERLMPPPYDYFKVSP